MVEMALGAFLLSAVILCSHEITRTAALGHLFARSGEAPAKRSTEDCNYYIHVGCMRLSDDHVQLLYDDDYVGLANSAEPICNDEFPRTEQCLEEKGCDMSDTPSLARYVKAFCSTKEDLKDALGCWETDYQSQLTVCRDEAENQMGSNFDGCSFLETFETCIRKWLEKTESCGQSATNVFEGQLTAMRDMTGCDD